MFFRKYFLCWRGTNIEETITLESSSTVFSTTAFVFLLLFDELSGQSVHSFPESVLERPVERRYETLQFYKTEKKHYRA